MKHPAVSVVIPAHNEEQLLGKTLQFVNQALTELDVEYEIVVVNDDSTDRTEEVARESGATVVSVQLRNIGAVRNAGAEAARFQNLIFVDADTLVTAQTFGPTLDALEDGAAGGARVELAEGPRFHWSKYLIFLSVAVIWLRLGRWAAGCYMFCRKDAFVKVGGFPEEYFAGEELFFSRRMKAIGKFVIIGHPVQTSARKLQDYSFWQLIRFIVRPIFSRKGMFKSREGLELLYEDARKSSSFSANPNINRD